MNDIFNSMTGTSKDILQWLGQQWLSLPEGVQNGIFVAIILSVVARTFLKPTLSMLETAAVASRYVLKGTGFVLDKGLAGLWFGYNKAKQGLAFLDRQAVRGYNFIQSKKEAKITRGELAKISAPVVLNSTREYEWKIEKQMEPMAKASTDRSDLVKEATDKLTKWLRSHSA